MYPRIFTDAFKRIYNVKPDESIWKAVAWFVVVTLAVAWVGSTIIGLIETWVNLIAIIIGYLGSVTILYIIAWVQMWKIYQLADEQAIHVMLYPEKKKKRDRDEGDQFWR